MLNIPQCKGLISQTSSYLQQCSQAAVCIHKLRHAVHAEVGKTYRLCSFGRLVLWISLRSQSDLLYRLNCHDDQQPVVGFVLRWTLDCWEQPFMWANQSTIKPLIQSSPILFPDDKLALHVSVLNFQQLLLCMRYAKIYLMEWFTYKHTMTTICLWGSANWGINILLHAHSHNAC